MKQHSAELLLDAIGQIDDHFVAEAWTPPARAAEKPFRFKLRHALVLTCLLLLLAFPVISLSIALQGAKESDPGDQAPNQEDCVGDPAGGDGAVEDINQYSGTTASLAAQLSAMQDDLSNRKAEQSTLPLADGTPRAIWQYEGSQELYVLPLTEEELAQLKALPSNSNVPASTPSLRLWISDGKGTVTSPYTDKTGTELFAYDATREPSSTWSHTFLAWLRAANP